MLIQDLPTELLAYCFSYLCPYARNSQKQDIRTLRLVSKRFNSVATPFLIQQINISLTTQSFADLATLASHPVYSKSIERVGIDLSYYDANLANSLQRFAENCATSLSRRVEIMGRGNMFRSEDGGYERKWKAIEEANTKCNEWVRINHDSWQDDWEHSNPLPSQKLLLDAWKAYQELYHDQEKAMEEGKHIERLVKALEAFPALKTITIQDLEFESRRERVELLSDEYLRRFCLSRSRWRGTFETAPTTKPPTQFVPDFFVALAASPVRPKKFDLSFSAPFDFRCLHFTEEEVSGVKTSLEQSTHVYFRVERWARKESLAENNDRPRDELDSLCRFSKAYFSSSKVQELHLSLDDYPAFYEFPQITLGDFVTLPPPSPSFAKVYFRAVPFTLSELKTFVSSAKPTLEWLNINGPYLTKGRWVDALPVLRQLDNLEHIELKFMKGGEFGDRWDSNAPNDDVVEEYIKREREDNPMVGWAE